MVMFCLSKVFFDLKIWNNFFYVFGIFDFFFNLVMYGNVVIKNIY